MRPWCVVLSGRRVLALMGRGASLRDILHGSIDGARNQRLHRISEFPCDLADGRSTLSSLWPTGRSTLSSLWPTIYSRIFACLRKCSRKGSLVFSLSFSCIGLARGRRLDASTLLLDKTTHHGRIHHPCWRVHSLGKKKNNRRCDFQKF